MEKLFNVLLDDPVKFALGASVFGLYFLFKKYDKNVDQTINSFKSDTRQYSSEIQNFMLKTTSDIQNVREGIYQDNKQFKEEIRVLKDEIAYLSDKVTIEIIALKSIYSPSEFTKKLAEYDKKLASLKEDYGRVIMLEKEMAKSKQQDEIHYKMFNKIAENIQQLKKKK